MQYMSDIFNKYCYFTMSLKKFINLSFLLLFLPFLITSCGMGVDTRKYPANPKEKVKKNMEEGRGFRLMDAAKKKSGIYKL